MTSLAFMPIDVKYEVKEEEEEKTRVYQKLGCLGESMKKGRRKFPQ